MVDIIHGTDASIGSIILNCINWDTEATTYADLVPAVRQILQDQFPDYRDLEQRLGQRLQFTVSETPATTTERGTTTVDSTYFTQKAPNDPVFVKQRRENVLLKRELKKVKQEQDTSMRSLDLDTKQTMRVMTGQLHIRAFQTPEQLLDTPAAFERWKDKIENSMAYHGIKTDEDRLPAMLEYGGEEIVDVHNHGSYPSRP